MGLTLGGEQVFAAMSEDGAEWSVTLDGTLQPWDEELFHDDGNPAAGTWSQVQLGLRRTTLSEDGRRWSWRGGAMWARAGSFPNLVQKEGDYNGGYVSYGFASPFADGWWLGPEISLILVEHEGSISEVGFFPQLVWRAERRF